MSKDQDDGGADVPGRLEQVYEDATASAGIGVWSWDLEIDRMWWSPTLCEIYGADDRGFRTSNDYMALIFPADRDLVGPIVGEVLSGQRTSYRMEHRIVRPGGAVSWTRSQGTLREDGGRRRVVGTVTVIDEEMTWRSEGLRIDRMDTVGKLVAGVAHDLNNLLTVILSQASLIEELDEGGAELARPVLAASERAAGLVRTLLDLSRKRGEEPESIDLKGTIEAQLEVLTPLVGEGVSIHLRADRGLWCVYMDPRRFEQVVLNLVVNARDAMEGSGDVYIRCRNVLVDESEGIEPRRFVCVEVEDTGPGIAPEVVPRMFDMFFTTKQEGKGTGLGLASCASIIESAGGKIVCENTERGARFRVYLPRHFSGPISFNSMEVRSLHRVLSASVLIIEDSRFLREWLGRALSHDGREVWTASSVEHARDMGLSSSLVNAVVSDVVLGQPGELELVREFARELDAPIVFMSGYDLDRVVDVVDIENEVFLPKPFNATMLLEAILAAFERDKAT